MTWTRLPVRLLRCRQAQAGQRDVNMRFDNPSHPQAGTIGESLPLYALPPEVTGAIKNYIMRDFPVRMDGPSQVALFAYDNGTFIVQSYLPTATDVKVSNTGNSTRLKNLVSGEAIDGQLPSPHRGWNWRNEDTEDRVSFTVHLEPHSYAVFGVEK